MTILDATLVPFEHDNLTCMHILDDTGSGITYGDQLDFFLKFMIIKFLLLDTLCLEEPLLIYMNMMTSRWMMILKWNVVNYLHWLVKVLQTKIRIISFNK